MRCDYIPENQAFWEDFLMQGYGLGAYAGVPYQRGTGIGAVFRGLFRAASPILKQIGLNFGKRAFEAGADIIGDVSEGKRFKSAAKERLKQKGKQSLGDIAATISKSMQGGKGVGFRSTSKSYGGIEKKRKRSKSIKRRMEHDIYNENF